MIMMMICFLLNLIVCCYAMKYRHGHDSDTDTDTDA
jgi:hypothetical protein